MQLIHKVMNFEIAQVDEEARTFWAVASTGEMDRQGDVIDPQGWILSNYLKNPVITWAHHYDQPPVAQATQVRVEDGALVFQARFPTPEEYPFADTVFRLYQGGYLRAFSVGFAPLESEVITTQRDGQTLVGTRYRKQELYEIACVTLPANPQALVAAGPEQPGGTRHVNPNPNQTPVSHPKPNHPPRPARLSPAARRALVCGALEALISRRLREHLGSAGR